MAASANKKSRNKSLENDAQRLLSQGRWLEAVTVYERLYRSKPRNWQVCLQLAKIHNQLKDFTNTTVWAGRALELNAEALEAHLLVGCAAIALENYSDAKHAFGKALDLVSSNTIALNGLGFALKQSGKPRDAMSYFRRLIEIDPNHAEAWNSLGACLVELKKTEEAESCLRRALALQPNYLAPWLGLANLQQLNGHYSAAVESYQKSLALDLAARAAHYGLASSFYKLGEIEKAIAAAQASIALCPPNSEDRHSAVSNLLMYLNYSDHHARDAVFSEHLRLAKQLCTKTPTPRGNFNHCRDENRRLRIAYLSPDFRRHSVAYFIEPVIRNHDRTRVEVYCYSNVKQADESTAVFNTLCDQWRDIVKLSDDAVVALIKQDRIDILVDLAGHTPENRLAVFAQRAAPIQITYLGYPNTTGLETMDYRISDDCSDPVGRADRFYSERLARMPRGFLCFQPPPDIAISPRRSGASARSVTFGSFNTPAKLSSKIIAIWARILASVPNSYLVLKYRFFSDTVTQKRVVDEFRKHAIADNRVRFYGQMPFSQHLDFYNEIDIALDTFPYNGTTTTLEALWMGVPVVTLAGEQHASRVGLSILSTLGMKELIATSGDQYVDIACALAAAIDTNEQCREHLRERVRTSVLLDAKYFTAQLESVYRVAWKHWVQDPYRIEPITSAGGTSRALPEDSDRAAVAGDANAGANDSLSAREALCAYLRNLHTSTAHPAVVLIPSVELQFLRCLAGLPQLTVYVFGSRDSQPPEFIASLTQTGAIERVMFVGETELAGSAQQAVVLAATSLQSKATHTVLALTRADTLVVTNSAHDAAVDPAAFTDEVAAMGFVPSGKSPMVFFWENRSLFGEVMYEQGEPALAIRAFESAIRHRPNDTRALNNLGAVSFQLGRQQAAEKFLARALAFNRRDPIALANLADIYRTAERYREAAPLYRIACDGENTDPRLWNHLGLCQTFTGDISGALVSYKNARACGDSSEQVSNLICELETLQTNSRSHQDHLSAKRILIVTNRLAPNALGEYRGLMADIAELLGERGHEVKLLTSGAAYRNVVPGIEATIERSLELCDIRQGDQIFYSSEAQRAAIVERNLHRVRGVIDSFQPEVCLVGDIDLLELGLFDLLLSANIPVVHYLENQAPCNLVEAIANIPCYRLVAAGSWLKQQAQACGYSARHIDVVYPGACVAEFSFPIAPALDKLRILCAGQAMSYEDAIVVVDALTTLRRQGVDFHCTITVASIGAELVERLKNIVVDAAIDSKVSFTGERDRRARKDWYATHNVFVCACSVDAYIDRWQVEAMAARLTVVNCSGVGNGELVRDGETGLIVAPNDAPALAQALIWLVSNGELWSKLSLTGQQTVVRDFDLQVSVDCLERKFNDVLGELPDK